MFFNVERVREVTPKASSLGSSQPSPLPSSSSSQIPQHSQLGFRVKETGSLSSSIVWALHLHEEARKGQKYLTSGKLFPADNLLSAIGFSAGHFAPRTAALVQ